MHNSVPRLPEALDAGAVGEILEGIDCVGRNNNNSASHLHFRKAIPLLSGWLLV